MKKLIILAIFSLVQSCGYDQNDGNAAGEVYCECMSKNNKTMPFFRASRFCDSTLALKFRLYHVHYYEASGDPYPIVISDDSLELAGKFIQIWRSHIRKNCCESLKNKDSIPNKTRFAY